jgi:DNA primase
MDFKVDVIEFLELMGVKNISARGDEVMFSCPFPGHKHGDTSPSASMNTNNTAWLCFGCQRRGNAATFLAEVEEVSVFASRKWLREYFGGGFREPIHNLASEIEDLFEETAKVVKVVNPELQQETLDMFMVDWNMVAENREAASEINGMTYMLDRGFSPQTLIDLEVGFDNADERAVLTVRDLDDKLIGFKGRAVRAEQQPRYRVYGRPRFGFAPYSTGEVVYLACKAKHTDGDIIVCEGELNALKMHEFGYKNAVGISGATFTKSHAEIIAKIADRVILYFDCDAPGITGARTAADLLVSRVPVLVVPKHDRDPADSTKEEVDDLISRAKTVLDPTNTYLLTEQEKTTS